MDEEHNLIPTEKEYEIELEDDETSVHWDNKEESSNDELVNSQSNENNDEEVETQNKFIRKSKKRGLMRMT